MWVRDIGGLAPHNPRGMATITCHDCGVERTRCPRNTRYCQLCRLLRELDYWQAHRTRRCSCGEVYCPLHRGDTQCGRCDPGLQRYSGVCALSAKDAPHEGRYPEHYLPVCTTCARDPKQRARLIRALTKGQAARRQANNWKEQHAG